MKSGGSFGCSEHEMVEFKILREVGKKNSSIRTVRADFIWFRDLLVSRWATQEEYRDIDFTTPLSPGQNLHEGTITHREERLR